MAIDRSFRVLNLYDVLTDLIPGVTFIAALMLVVPVETFIVIDTAPAILVVGIVGYICGHLIQFARSKLYEHCPWIPDPRNFKRIAFQLSMNGRGRTDLGNIGEIDRAFLPLCREQFDLSDDFSDWDTLFRMVITYLETRPESRAVRFQAIHSFCWSMAMASFLVAIAAIVGLLASPALPTRPTNVLFGTLVFGLALAYGFERRRQEFNRVFVEYIISDFYVSQHRNK